MKADQGTLAVASIGLALVSSWPALQFVKLANGASRLPSGGLVGGAIGLVALALGVEACRRRPRWWCVVCLVMTIGILVFGTALPILWGTGLLPP